jgi:hypothetical protein
LSIELEAGRCPGPAEAVERKKKSVPLVCNLNSYYSGSVTLALPARLQHILKISNFEALAGSCNAVMNLRVGDTTSGARI